MLTRCKKYGFAVKLQQNKSESDDYEFTVPGLSSAVRRAMEACVTPCGPVAVVRDVIVNMVTSRLRRSVRSSSSDVSAAFGDAPSLSLHKHQL